MKQSAVFKSSTELGRNKEASKNNLETSLLPGPGSYNPSGLQTIDHQIPKKQTIKVKPRFGVKFTKDKEGPTPTTYFAENIKNKVVSRFLDDTMPQQSVFKSNS